MMKFGGSSLATAERMREIGDLIQSFPEERPVIGLFAMGKTTSNLLLVMHQSILFYFLLIYFPRLVFLCGDKWRWLLVQAGEKAVSCGVSNSSEIEELCFIKELHLRCLESYFSVFFGVY